MATGGGWASRSAGKRETRAKKLHAIATYWIFLLVLGRFKLGSCSADTRRRKGKERKGKEGVCCLI
jgi:hypothetical protein